MMAKKPLRARAWLTVAAWVPRNVNAWVVRHAQALSAWASVVALIGVPLLFLGGLVTYLQLRGYLVRPDVQLFVQQPMEPLFRLVNPTSVLAREPKYQVTLFDLDDPTANGARNLEIPVKVLEWILPKGAIGPWSFFSLSKIAGTVPKGHVVFGWVALQCPNCQQPRHYWVLIKRGETAWYSEIPPDEWPSITKNLSAVVDVGTNYPALLERLAPIERRVRAYQAG